MAKDVSQVPLEEQKMAIFGVLSLPKKSAKLLKKKYKSAYCEFTFYVFYICLYIFFYYP